MITFAKKVGLALGVILCIGTTPVAAASVTDAVCITAQETTNDIVEATQGKVSISLNESKMTLKKGKNKTLKVKVKGVTASSVLEQQKITWKSSNKKVATVSSKGVVKAKKKGTCKITATIDGTDVKTTCKITVKSYKTIRVKTTGYCNCRKCAGKWAGARTASGTKPKQGRTIAVDPKLIKLGTKVEIDGKVYTAEDTGGAIKGKKIDIYYSSHSKAHAHGVKYKTIKVYQ